MTNGLESYFLGENIELRYIKYNLSLTYAVSFVVRILSFVVRM